RGAQVDVEAGRGELDAGTLRGGRRRGSGLLFGSRRRVGDRFEGVVRGRRPPRGGIGRGGIGRGGIGRGGIGRGGIGRRGRFGRCSIGRSGGRGARWLRRRGRCPGPRVGLRPLPGRRVRCGRARRAAGRRTRPVRL